MKSPLATTFPETEAYYAAIILNKYLHQIIRDIRFLRDKWQSKIKLIKVIAYQDKKKSADQLT